jgi:hypothetical protein
MRLHENFWVECQKMNTNPATEAGENEAPQETFQAALVPTDTVEVLRGGRLEPVPRYKVTTEGNLNYGELFQIPAENRVLRVISQPQFAPRVASFAFRQVVAEEVTP